MSKHQCPKWDNRTIPKVYPTLVEDLNEKGK
jgi:hypothetical protein